MYINNIEIVKEFRNIPKGFKMFTHPITLLVGEQGCGKSSLLKLLQENDSEFIKVNLNVNCQNEGVSSYFFDTEHNNPRVAPDWHYTNMDGSEKGIGVSGKVISMFQSHGEALREFTVNRIPDAKDCVLLLDEPEAALSIRNQYKLAKVVKEAVNNNCQLIIATHCLPLIEEIGTVYDLENKVWKDSSDFIKEQKNI